ncbi:Alpha/Beta hydrolase protein [Endogone sp. FLAS-F59071]|nr:Alpha/Beta hydrolase protein [Endogone sp. FLAS-F59071]|eukprot:RUS17822.1 Alpha/Beta hydrolase protein [Endogone sp. FLAS-F59071]
MRNSPLLPNYVFPLCIFILCLLPPFISSSALPDYSQSPFAIPEPAVCEANNDADISLPMTLSLKHIYHHGSSGSEFANLFRRLDFTPDQLSALSVDVDEETSFVVNMRLGKTFKPSPEHMHVLRTIKTNGEMRNAMQTAGEGVYQPGVGWLPNVSDNETIVTLAKMTHNAYNDANKRDDWYELGERWGVNNSFGWEADGLRGHIFVNDDNTTLVMSLKGTSAGLFGGGETGVKDKLNDNLLFSCCCARVGSSWKTVCDCYTGNDYECDQECVEDSLSNEELYYSIAMKIFLELYALYPNATVWVTGHSLGGSLASLLGLTFGLPTVTYQIPGERRAASRLHLPGPPALNYSEIPLWHIGHTADPIFMGVCTGPSSSCWYGGFAMETRCHSGRTCVYDVVNQSGWKVDVRSHRIRDVIENLLTKWDTVPECTVEEECSECGIWNFTSSMPAVPESMELGEIGRKRSCQREP